MTGFLTPAARRHIQKMVAAIAPHADRLDARFRSWLRRQGYDPAQQQALLAITAAAASRLSSLSRFLEQLEYNGRRLAKLNVSPSGVVESLAYFQSLLEPVLAGKFTPACEQLQLASRLVSENAFYQVREAEAQAFFRLYRAETEAADLDDLFRRVLAVLAQTFHAAGAGLLLQENLPPELSRSCYIEHGQPEERLIADRKLRGRYACYWSYPLGPSAVIQLAFRQPYPWLPREQTLLAAAAARCRQAVERTKMAQELRHFEAQARRAEEEERKRIGRDLHDEAGQAIAFLRLQLEMLEREAPESLRPRLKEACELAARTAVELRRIVAALSPAVLDRLGLETALRHLVARFRRTHTGEVHFRTTVSVRLSRQAEEIIYRIAQECLQNIAKHSRATCVKVSLVATDKHIRLSVRDNGAGFCADQAANKPMCFGLMGMKERAALAGGKLSIRSAPNQGAWITLELPPAARLVESHGKDSGITN